MGEIIVRNMDFQVRHLLNPLQDFQSAAATLALQWIRRIGHKLQFVQDELRNDYGAIQELCVRNIGYAAVNNHAGVEHLERMLQAPLAAKKSSERLQIEHVALIRAQNQPGVCHHQ